MVLIEIKIFLLFSQKNLQQWMSELLLWDQFYNFESTFITLPYTLALP